MKLPKFLFLLASITFFVFLYVHEQVSKVILLYDLQKGQKERVVLGDARDFLKIQVSTLESPRSLETALAKKNLLLDLPSNHKTIRLAMEEKGARKNNLLDFLSNTKVAEADSR